MLSGLSTWHIITSEFPPQPGGVSDYTAQLAPALAKAGQPNRVWCRELGSFSQKDLQSAGRLLDQCPPPRRLLLQWVPHGYGYRSMNLGFCRWIAQRPEPLEIMVHEPGLGFGEGGIRHNAVAAVHRAMAAILLWRAERVWISIPGWEPRLRPYAFGHQLPFTWLPVPSNIPVMEAPPGRTNPIGYFGHYDEQSREVLAAILDLLPVPVLLLGRGAEQIQHRNAIVVGELPADQLSLAIQSCQIMFHWFPGGVSSRRGTVMASLAHRTAVVTNQGRWTEPLWRESSAVALASDAAGMVLQLENLLANASARETLREKAFWLYKQYFALQNTIHKLIFVRR